MAQITLNSTGVASSGALALQSNGTTTAVTVDTSQNVGIGTTSPTARLHVQSTGGTVFNLKDNTASGGGYANIFFSSDTVNANGILGYNNSTNAMTFGTNNTERVRITSGGLMLVGTSSVVNAETGLGVANSTSGDAVTAFRNSRNTSGDVCSQLFVGSNCQNTSSYLLQGGVFGVANVFYVFGNGNVQNTNNSYGAISDVKLKENIVDATPKLNDVLNLKVRNFNLKTEPNNKQIGFIAQEFEEVFPSMIDESPDKDEDGNELSTKTKAVKYSVFVPMLIKAIQELKTEFDAYKASHP